MTLDSHSVQPIDRVMTSHLIVFFHGSVGRRHAARSVNAQDTSPDVATPTSDFYAIWAVSTSDVIASNEAFDVTGDAKTMRRHVLWSMIRLAVHACVAIRNSQTLQSRYRSMAAAEAFDLTTS